MAAVHIQQWLSRTPELRLLRGGSRLLHTATENATISRLFDPAAGIEVAEEGGDVDGVVVLRTRDARQANAATDRVLRHLRCELPGVDWDCWWATAANYPAAYRAAHNSGKSVVGRRSILPARSEFPAAETCAGCHGEPAIKDRTHVIGSDTVGPYGQDCENRFDAAKPLRDTCDPIDFDELARCGGRRADEPSAIGRRDLRSHLATICADGNRVGELFDIIADEGDPSVRQRCASILTDAIRSGLSVAETEAACDSADTTSVNGYIRHFVGGDDIFCSIPAVLAWRFVRTMLTSFVAAVSQQLQQHNDIPAAARTAIENVSLGVGIVFADAHFPVADSRHHAELAMTQAKVLARGNENAVSWMDLTVEHHLPRRRWLNLAHLDELHDGRGLRHVMDLPASARAALYDQVGRGGTAGRESIPVIRGWAERTGRAELLAALTGTSPSSADDLEGVLSLSRWWPSR